MKEKPGAPHISESYMKNFKGNKYLLVNVAAQRARQINDGVETYVRIRSRHPLDMALEEIRQGYIDFELGAAPEIDTAPSYEDLMTFEEMLGVGEGFDLEDIEEDSRDIEAFDLEDDLMDLEAEGIIDIDDIDGAEE